MHDLPWEADERGRGKTKDRRRRCHFPPSRFSCAPKGGFENKTRRGPEQGRKRRKGFWLLGNSSGILPCNNMRSPPSPSSLLLQRPNCCPGRKPKPRPPNSTQPPLLPFPPPPPPGPAPPVGNALSAAAAAAILLASPYLAVVPGCACPMPLCRLLQQRYLLLVLLRQQEQQQRQQHRPKGSHWLPANVSPGTLLAALLRLQQVHLHQLQQQQQQQQFQVMKTRNHNMFVR